ncbi:MAG: filamentous hemagglutinin N-terminal domain-containing protein, partial [Cyanobacteriota bacterium]
MTFFSLPAFAQIVPDATLGSENSQVTPNANVRGLPGDRIDGGAVRGSSLFHSFSEFNVNNGQRVYFTDPAGITNIFSRVTGLNVSNILGTLGVDGAANLFLLNPNGIFFGPNAVVDIQGSFVATTGDRFVFPGGAEFGASNPQAPPLLTMSVPVGVQYGVQPGTITNAGNLTVGQDLTLAGGNLDLQGELRAGRDLTLQAQNTVRARDSATNPFIASAGGKLVVQGNQSVDIVALSHPTSGLFSSGDMVLRSANTVGGDIHYWSGGNFRIETLDGNLGNLFSPADPVIRASGDVTFDSYEGASLHIFAGGSVTITGNVEITGADTVGNAIAENVTLSDGTTIIPIDGTIQPTLDIRAGTTAINPPGITGDTTGFTSGVPGTGGTGTSADISINSISINDNIPNNGGIIFLTNQYQPNSLVSPNGITIGSIEIRDGGSIVVDSRSGITLNGRVDTFPTNNSNGTVTLLAGSNITVNSTVDTSIDGLGGDVKLSAGGNVTLNGVLDASTAARTDGLEPEGGAITVQAGGNITINPNGFIDTSAINFDFDSNTNSDPTFDTNQLIGRAGDVFLKAGGNITLSDTGILAAGATGGFVQLISAGDTVINNSFIDATTESNINNSPGFIDITSRSLSIKDSALDVGSFGQGDAGYIGINATDIILIDNSILLSDVTQTNGGSGGYIGISGARTIQISNNSVLTTESDSQQNGPGNIFIQGNDSVLVSNSTIDSNSKSSNESASFGDIKIEATTGSVFLDNSTVSAQSSGPAFAGDIFIDARDRIEITNNSKIAANGNFGRIFIGQSTPEPEQDPTLPQTVVISGSNLTTTNSAATGVDSNQGILSGDITIRAIDEISMLNNSTLEAQTTRRGDAGFISLITGNGTSGRISLDNSTIFNNVEAGGIGNSGLVSMQSGSLALTNGAQVQTLVRGTDAQGNIVGLAQGNAGNVQIQVSGNVDFDGSDSNGKSSGIFSSVEQGGQGNAGSIAIEAGSLSLTNGARLDVNNKVQGNAGDIKINANRITLNNGTEISAATAGGDGGNINIITATDLLLRNRSNISTS